MYILWEEGKLREFEPVVCCMLPSFPPLTQIATLYASQFPSPNTDQELISPHQGFVGPSWLLLDRVGHFCFQVRCFLFSTPDWPGVGGAVWGGKGALCTSLVEGL